MEDDNKHTEVRRMKRWLRCKGRKNPPSFLQTSALYIDVVAAWHILPRSEGEVTVALHYISTKNNKKKHYIVRTTTA